MNALEILKKTKELIASQQSLLSSDTPLTKEVLEPYANALGVLVDMLFELGDENFRALGESLSKFEGDLRTTTRMPSLLRQQVFLLKYLDGMIKALHRNSGLGQKRVFCKVRDFLLENGAIAEGVKPHPVFRDRLYRMAETLLKLRAKSGDIELERLAEMLGGLMRALKYGRPQQRVSEYKAVLEYVKSRCR